MPTIEVILTEKIASLGAEADVVKVTPATLRRINQLKAKRAAREAAELNESEDLARRIGKLKITIALETGETGKAFGSITAKDIADRLQSELGVEIDRHRIELERPIKETGAHEVTIKLHHDVSAKLTLTVKSTSEEKSAEAAPSEEEVPAGGFKAKAKAKHSK